MNIELIMKNESVEAHEKYMYFVEMQLSASTVHHYYFKRQDLLRTDSIKCILTLRRLMSYICMEHPFLMFLDHTRRRSTVGRTPLDE